MLFIIPIIIDVHGHTFEIVTLVSEIHENVDLVLGIKNIFELEGTINRLIPFFPKEQVILKLREQWFKKIETPFVDEILGLGVR